MLLIYLYIANFCFNRLLISLYKGLKPLPLFYLAILSMLAILILYKTIEEPLDISTMLDLASGGVICGLSRLPRGSTVGQSLLIVLALRLAD